MVLVVRQETPFWGGVQQGSWKAVNHSELFTWIFCNSSMEEKLLLCQLSECKSYWKKKNVVIMQPLGIERVRDEEKEILTSVWWANFWILCNLNLASFISNSFCPVSFLENTSGLTFQSARTFSYWGASCFFPMSHISERGLRLGEGEEAKSWRFAFLYLIFFFVCLFLFLLFLFCYFNWVDGYLCERISQLLFDPMTEN